MRKARRFTGYHATAIIVAFFAVVIGVNVLMATFAVGTFGGVVVENSYVASQKFNGWLKEAHVEQQLGWSIPVPVVDADGHVRVRVDDGHGQPIQDAIIGAEAEHPLGRAPEQSLTFVEFAPGAYRSTRPLPAGRWKIWLRVTHGGQHVDKRFDLS